MTEEKKPKNLSLSQATIEKGEWLAKYLNCDGLVGLIQRLVQEEYARRLPESVALRDAAAEVNAPSPVATSIGVSYRLSRKPKKSAA